MSTSSRFLLGTLLFLSLLFSSSRAQQCSSYSFSNTSFTNCADLPYLDCFLHWNVSASQDSVSIAFRKPSTETDSWIAWGLNPSNTKMVGTQALVAYAVSNGSVTYYTSNINSYSTSLPKGDLSFNVTNLSATYNNKELIIFATLGLSGLSMQQVWQDGPVTGGAPAAHAMSGANLQSFNSLNFLSGQTGSSGGGSRTRKKNIHGVLNAVSWGILMPMGAMIARYLKVSKAANPAWFYLHVACQCSAYIVGVAGWGTGLKLGSDSKGITYHSHRNIGIALFSIGTLQLFALLLRPKPDHKYRIYWNVYHHAVGYTVIILSIINIFKGFDILNPDDKWKHAYIGIIACLGGISVFLEAFTWIVVLRRKKADGSAKSPSGVNGANGYRQNV